MLRDSVLLSLRELSELQDVPTNLMECFLHFKWGDIEELPMLVDEIHTKVSEALM
jgi:hypothetical protein